MVRPSLGGNLGKPQAGAGGDYQAEMEAVSCHLPVELTELYEYLAEERLWVERAEKCHACRVGEKPPQARCSASAIVREAMEAYRPKPEAELRAVRSKG